MEFSFNVAPNERNDVANDHVIKKKIIKRAKKKIFNARKSSIVAVRSHRRRHRDVGVPSFGLDFYPPGCATLTASYAPRMESPMRAEK